MVDVHAALGMPHMRLMSFAVATALITAPGIASAQSVLERVIGQIDDATNLVQVNGVYANIAESIGEPSIPGTSTTEAVPVGVADAPGDTLLWRLDWLTDINASDIGTTFTAGDGTAVGTVLQAKNIEAVTVNADGSITLSNTGAHDAIGVYDTSTGTTTDILAADTLTEQTFTPDPTALVYENGAAYALLIPAISGGRTLVTQEVTTTALGYQGISTTIDGSITNIIAGVTSATQEAVAGSATATEFVMPTYDFGDMATTALGAVNTGDITLGVNSAVDEAATTTTRAISAVMTQIGGSADTGALVLNVASNAGAINGSIQNTMAQVNGTIGDLSTTALGAVNTGTIVSGVNATVAGIVGMSGQTASGL